MCDLHDSERVRTGLYLYNQGYIPDSKRCTAINTEDLEKVQSRSEPRLKQPSLSVTPRFRRGLGLLRNFEAGGLMSLKSLPQQCPCLRLRFPAIQQPLPRRLLAFRVAQVQPFHQIAYVLITFWQFFLS